MTRRTFRSPAFDTETVSTAGGLIRTHSAVTEGIISCWLRWPGGLDINRSFWASDTGKEQFWISTIEKISFRWGGTNISSSNNAISTDQWQHLFVRFGDDFDGSGNDAEILLDNVRVAIGAGGTDVEIDDASPVHHFMQDDGEDEDFPGEVFDFIFDSVDPTTVGPTDYNYSTASGGEWTDTTQVLHATLSYRPDGQNVSDAGEDSGPAGNDFTQSTGGGDTTLHLTNVPPGANPAGATGAGAQTLEEFTQLATGVMHPSGLAAQTVELFTQLATGTAPYIGAAAQTLEPFAQLVAGEEKFIGISAQSLELMTQLVSGVHTDSATGTVEQTLELLVQVAAGLELFIGTSEQTLELFTQVSSGKAEAVGSAAQALELITQLAAGVELFTGTVEQVLELLTQVSSGAHTEGATGTANQTLESLVQTSTGVELFTGTAAQTLELLSQLSSGTHTPITGTVIQVLELLTQVIAGVMQPSGTVTQTLELLTQLGTGALQPSGVAAQTLEELSQLGVGISLGAHEGTVEQTLELLIQAAVGLVLAVWGEESAVTGGWIEEDAVTDGWTEENPL